MNSLIDSVKFFIVFLFLVILSSCSKGFQQINTNPNTITTIIPSALLTNVLANTANIEQYNDPSNNDRFSADAEVRFNFLLTGSFAQQWSGVGFFLPSVYNIINSDYDEALWRSYYLRAIASGKQFLNAINGDSTLLGYIAVVRLLNVYNFSLLTDTYGDIPYAQAGQGTQGFTTPIYDLQKDIYTDMLNQLDTIGQILAKPNLPAITGDISNNATSFSAWRRSCYQLMVRLAMRLVRVDPTTAQLYVEKAVQTGLLSPNMNVNNAWIINSDQLNYANSRSYVLFSNLGGLSQGYQTTNQLILASTYTQVLKSNGEMGTNYSQDPRIFLWPVVLDMNGNEIPTKATPSDTALVNGYTYGLDPTTFTGNFNTSVARIRTVFGAANAPVILISNAQTMFLLSEAAVRGWKVGASDSAYYINGVNSAINESALYGVDNTQYIPDGYVTNYLAYKSAQFSKVSNNAIAKLQLINTEYWLDCMLNGVEAFVNWRRTSAIDNNYLGYPALVVPPNVGLASNKQIPRRLVYPVREQSTNNNNYQNAISRLTNGDRYYSRMYLDPVSAPFYNVTR